MQHGVPNDIWITQAEAINFQSLKHVMVKLINGSNAFVGETNSGKTAMLRSIFWCLLNNLRGDYFITIGEEEAIVRVSLSNGKMIERRKSRTNVNLYRLYDNGELVGEYTGFGTSVPEEIIEAHGIRPIAGDIYFQISEQLESAFLLSLKPSKRADVLGNMEELRQIDSALKSINEDIRSNVKSQKELIHSNKQLNKEMKKITLETERAKQSIETLKLLSEGLHKKMSMRDYLFQQITRLKKIQAMTQIIAEDLAQSKLILDMWPTDFDEKFERFKELSRYIKRLKEIKEEVRSIQLVDKDNLAHLTKLKDEIEVKFTAYQQLNLSIKRLKAIEAQKVEAEKGLYPELTSIDLEPLEKQLVKYKLMFNHVERLREIDKSKAETKKVMEEATLKVDQTLENLVAAIQDAKLCPTCGQQTHGVCSENIESIV